MEQHPCLSTSPSSGGKCIIEDAFPLWPQRMSAKFSRHLGTYTWNPYRGVVMQSDLERVKRWYERTAIPLSCSQQQQQQYPQELQRQEKVERHRYQQQYHHHYRKQYPQGQHARRGNESTAFSNTVRSRKIQNCSSVPQNWSNVPQNWRSVPHDWEQRAARLERCFADCAHASAVAASPTHEHVDAAGKRCNH